MVMQRLRVIPEARARVVEQYLCVLLAQGRRQRARRSFARRYRLVGRQFQGLEQLGAPVGSTAPASRSAFSSLRIARRSPSTSSTSISSNSRNVDPFSTTSTASWTTSATSMPSSCTSTPDRRVRRVATRLKGRPLVCAVKRRATSSGTRRSGAGHSSSTRHRHAAASAARQHRFPRDPADAA